MATEQRRVNPAEQRRVNPAEQRSSANSPDQATSTSRHALDAMLAELSPQLTEQFDRHHQDILKICQPAISKHKIDQVAILRLIAGSYQYCADEADKEATRLEAHVTMEHDRPRP